MEIRLGNRGNAQKSSHLVWMEPQTAAVLVGYEWHSALRGAISMSIQWRKKRAELIPPFFICRYFLFTLLLGCFYFALYSAALSILPFLA